MYIPLLEVIKHNICVTICILFVSSKCSSIHLPRECKETFNVRNLDGLTPPTCIFGTVGASPDLKASCPRYGVIRVTGDYNELHINCTALYPIDFTFDGILPTEAITVYTWRKIDENQTGLNLSITSFHTDVTVRSIPALFSYLKKTLGHVNTSDVFNYSRTGEYTFSGYFGNRKYNVSYYIFLEEPFAKPEFIRNNNTRLSYLSNGTQVLVPCRATHMNLHVMLWQFDVRSGDLSTRLTPVEVKVIVNDPAKGFVALVDDPRRSYMCNFDGDEPVDTLIFDKFNLGASLVPYGFLEPLDLDKGRARIEYENLATSHGRYVTRTKCTIEDGHGPGMLYTISSPNFYEIKLLKYFVLPAFVNRSYSVEFGVQSEDLKKKIKTPRGTTVILGASFCGDSNVYNAVNFGITLSGESYLFSFNENWEIVNREKSNISIYFRISHNHGNETLYEFEEITFFCRIIIQVFAPPVVWFVQYRNGTIKREFIDYELDEEISYFTTTMYVNVTKVSCAASIWHKVFWRNISMDLTVKAPEKPQFEGNSSEEYVTVTTDSQLALKCTASGSPLPEVYWTVEGRAQNGSISNEDQKVSSVLTIENPTKATYVCTAKNSADKEQKFYHVRIASSNGVNIGAIIGVALAVFVVTGAGAFIYYQYFWEHNQLGLNRYEIADFLNGEKDESGTRGGNEYVHEYAHLCAYDSSYEIDETRFQIDKTSSLGSGAFGVVLKGLVDGMPVAVKTLSRHAEKSHLKALLSELKIQIHLGNHPNLVRFVGASTKHLNKGSVSMFVELCPLGSLENYLRTNKDGFQPLLNETRRQRPVIILKDMLDWTVQIANGMEYLGEKKVIHGDLAARNVLLDQNRTAKITDFGLSRQQQAYAEYVKKQVEPLPWRWMALESLKNLAFSSKSDMWAFGVTLWEIFSLGDIPYAGLSWNINFVTQLESGMRLLRPKHSSEALYKYVMRACWNERPDDRPSYAFVKSAISDEISQGTENSALDDTNGTELETGPQCSNSQVHV